jgi:hypothetical protein
MALRPQFSLIHSEFNEFLFAPVGEEENGTELTVLSALARLGIDPWAEAARLSALPKEAAARALATTIAMLPEGHWTGSDVSAIAARLVSRLRRGPAVAGKPPPGEGGGNDKAKSWIAAWLICTVVFAAVLLATSYLHADRVSAPASSAVSSTEQ